MEPRPGEIDLEAEIERERENYINVEPSNTFKERRSPASEDVHTQGLTRVGAPAEDALPEAEDEQTDDLGRSSQSDQYETASTSLDLEALSEDEVRLSDPALATEPGAENPVPNTGDLNQSGPPTVP
ncbi:MAG: hypothetical protein ACO391_10105, partial [Pseudomonadales bacterium]